MEYTEVSELLRVIIIFSNMLLKSPARGQKIELTYFNMAILGMVCVQVH